MPVKKTWQQIVALIDGIFNFLGALLLTGCGAIVLLDPKDFAEGFWGALDASSMDSFRELGINSAEQLAGSLGIVGGSLFVCGLVRILWGILAVRASKVPSKPGAYFGFGIVRFVAILLITLLALLGGGINLSLLGFTLIALFRVIVGGMLRPIAVQQQQMLMGGYGLGYPQPGMGQPMPPQGGFPQQQMPPQSGYDQQPPMGGGYPMG